MFEQFKKPLLRWLAQPLALMAVLVIVGRWLGVGAVFISMQVTDWLLLDSDHRLGALSLLHVLSELETAFLQHVIEDWVGAREARRVRVRVTVLVFLFRTTPAAGTLRLLFNQSGRVSFLRQRPWSRLAAPLTLVGPVARRWGGQCSQMSWGPRAEGSMWVPAWQAQKVVVVSRLTVNVTISFTIGLQNRRAGCSSGLLGQLFQTVVW